jgi:hypothetical protein
MPQADGCSEDLTRYCFGSINDDVINIFPLIDRPSAGIVLFGISPIVEISGIAASILPELRANL